MKDPFEILDNLEKESADPKDALNEYSWDILFNARQHLTGVSQSAIGPSAVKAWWNNVSFTQYQDVVWEYFERRRN